jgi:protein arginine kinase
MNFDELWKGTGEWLRSGGPMSEVVVSSRIRLARNVDGLPFLSTAGPAERTEIYRCVTNAITSVAHGEDVLVVDIETAQPVDQSMLVERHLISRQHVNSEGSRGVTISSDETRVVMINEEDHLRIQGIRGGLRFDAVWEDVDALDDAIASQIGFSFDNKLGYLTACPTNVGTGIRVSVMLHLPALRLTKEIERVARAARDLKLAVRGSYGEGTEAVGDLYQISNQTTLGKSEESIINTFSNAIIPKMVEYEQAARETLVRHHASQLDDKIWRAYGLLCNARRITSGETQSLLSPIRMGIHLGRFDRLDIATLNELFLFTQSGHLQKMVGRTLDEEERATARADYLRKRLGSTA